MAKHYNTQKDSASLSAFFFFYVHNVISFINETGWLMFGFQHKHINSIVEF